MLKKRGRAFIFSAVFSQIFLIVLSVFSFAFLIGGAELVRGQNDCQNNDECPTSFRCEISTGTCVPESSSGSSSGGGGAAGAINTVGGVVGTAQPVYEWFVPENPSPAITPTGTPGPTGGGAPGGGTTAGTSGGGGITATLPPGVTPELEVTRVFSDIPNGAEIHGLPGGSILGDNVAGIGKIGNEYFIIGKNGEKLSGALTQAQVGAFENSVASVGGKTVKPYTDALGITSGGLSFLIDGFIWAAAVAGAVQLLGRLAGLEENLVNTLSLSLAGGIMTAQILRSLGPSGFNTGLAADSFLVSGAGPWLIGLGVAALIFILTYKDEKQKLVTFECLPYEPPLGGRDCEICNKDKFRPCTEYRCKSLGQACDIVNKGTKEERCAWINRNDVNAPTITPWTNVLTVGHKYTPNNAIRPPAIGSKIVKDGTQNGCIKPFTPLQFGITTNEPSQCKIDTEHTTDYDNMTFFFGESNLFRYNHTQKLTLPAPPTNTSGEGSPQLPANTNYNLYARCIDPNGNGKDSGEYVFTMCVDPSPDTTAPEIADTSIKSGSPVRFGVGNVSLQVYTNEPSECRWSPQDKSYDQMENTMGCSTAVTEINARLLFTCTTKLTGIRDREENKYYFRCKDLPGKPENERNVNQQSYPFTLRGSQPLNIIKVGPNETITNNTQVVGVDLTLETSNGAEEGKAICYFSPTGVEGSYIQMFETNNFEHRQKLTLSSGNYTYRFRCADAGGNADNRTTSFSVFVDNAAPIVTRAYREIDALKIVTNEDTECAYSFNSCNYNFNEGVRMIYSNPSIKSRHFAPWQVNRNYYIKCKDLFGNQPNPDACSLVANAASIA